MNLISVIVPCWNEEETIPIYYEHMCPVVDAIDADCELIFVDEPLLISKKNCNYSVATVKVLNSCEKF